MVSFTGSSVVGREVMAAAGGTMKRILLECGGKSASIVLDDVEVTDELLQRMLFECCSLHAGQACILHSRLLLPDAIHDEVVDRLVALARAVKVGDPTDPDVQMGPLISACAVRTRRRHTSIGARQRRRQAGDRRRSAGRSERWLLLRADDSHRASRRTRPSPRRRCSDRCCRCCATATTTTPSRSPTTRSTGCPARCGAPTSTVRSRSPAGSAPARSRSTDVGPGDAPFGGFKQSGIGREGGGIVGLHQYMEPKAIGVPA